MISLLDIEGTICSISFVKDVLYPYFSAAYRGYLKQVTFPPKPDQNELARVLCQFPPHTTDSEAAFCQYIDGLVAQDIKDPALKSFQGHVWKAGYTKGELKAPLYADAIEFLRHDDIYIYSSGSVAAQKLLFGHVDVNGTSTDMNPRICGYFDITTSGLKTQASSYTSICQSIGCSPEHVTFYSDNIHEIHAAKAAGLNYTLVVREGNAPVSEQDKAGVPTITSFE